MSSEWEPNPQPFGSQMTLQPSHTGQGKALFFKIVTAYVGITGFIVMFYTLYNKLL